MRLNLPLSRCSILFFTCCFLFFAVALENANDADAITEEIATNTTFTPIADTTESDDVTREEILPNYKKIKKLPDNAESEVLPKVVRENDEIVIARNFDDANGGTDEMKPLKHSSSSNNSNSNSSLYSELNDDHVIPSDGNIDGVKNEVPLSEVVNVIKKDHPNAEDKAEDNGLTDANLQISLPDIKEIPTVTVTEVPLEILEPQRSNLEAIIIKQSNESAQGTENRTLDILEQSNDVLQKDDQIIKINDSGGADGSGGGGGYIVDDTTMLTEANDEIPHVSDNIPNEITINTDASTVSANVQQLNVSTLDIPAQTINLTTEEVPMPVFSEWAQKQMEAAEKQQAMEKEVVNTSTQKKNNNTNGNGKLQPMKIRAKNYASPDCGAKIIASNVDATNTGAVLSSSKDEYMLSPCGNRIWFVVELCEAIQARKIDLANFELFSSSPKNFTVAVSNRFPTRDWSNVGRFIAEDKRNVQSFELHPHLFGKFVRVDIQSHYSKEHFCPVSLFRVFGTSEFEAFETENHPNEEMMDEFDEEFVLEQNHAKNSENNLFKSASDAVLSIVKKAAEVLAKPASNPNQTLTMRPQTLVCHSPAFGQFSCTECNPHLVERINNVLSCNFAELNMLLKIEQLQNHLLDTHVCTKGYGIKMSTPNEDCMRTLERHYPKKQMDLKQSYFLNLLSVEYIGALCHLLAETQETQKRARNSTLTMIKTKERDDETGELSLNLTIDKKLRNDNFKIIDGTARKFVATEETAKEFVTTTEGTDFYQNAATTVETTTMPTETASGEDEQLQRLPTPIVENTIETPLTLVETTNAPPADVSKEAPAAPDINIFNVPASEKTDSAEYVTTEINYEASGEQLIPTTTATTTTTSDTPSTEATMVPMTGATGASKGEEDPSAWDSFENLLTSTAAPGNGVASSTANSGSTGGAYNSVNLQQRIPSGPHSESVFIRLSNRIKTLERNMSLSGQYLEELSRRYKKQVEELQQTLSQQTLTVRTLEQQNRRHNELEQLYAERSAQLKDELDDLTLQVHACIAVIIFVGAFVFLVLMAGILLYRSMCRDTQEIRALRTCTGGSGGGKRKSISHSAATQKKLLLRRKSFEDFSDHQQRELGKSTTEKQRRPSEEAMLILKDCGDSDAPTTETVGDASQIVRQRKMSVCCYESGNNNKVSTAAANNGRLNNSRLRNHEKHSWPNSAQSQQQAQQHLVELRGATTDNITQLNGGSADYDDISGGAKSARNRQKKLQNLLRHESQSDEVSDDKKNYATANNSGVGSDYDEKVILDEEDLDNFIPNTDLAYNEFMPEGPSGYHVIDGSDRSGDVSSSKENKLASKKSRRLSSPAFFKSPFSKSFKSKSSSSSASSNNKTSTQSAAHQSTSWEWYRLKKTDQRQQKPTTSASFNDYGGFQLRTSPSRSYDDSSSLSEIHFPTSSTENSFRILEEAILSSGELPSLSNDGKSGSVAPVQSNGNGGSKNGGAAGSSTGTGSSCSGSSSNRSSTTSSYSNSQKKKKSRGFNKIFRKVF